jgi:hypothetical protein
MKFFVLFFVGVWCCLTGCSQMSKNIVQDNIIPSTWIYSNINSDFEQGIFTGNTLSWWLIQWKGYSVEISWGILTYTNLFSISIPENLLIWTNEYQWSEIIRLDFSVNTQPDIWTQWYFKLFVEHVPARKSSYTNKEKCVSGEYEDGVISTITTSKNIKQQEVYLTNINFSAQSKNRDQRDVCFINNDIIYTLSIWSYDNVFLQKIVNSFDIL